MDPRPENPTTSGSAIDRQSSNFSETVGQDGDARTPYRSRSFASNFVRKLSLHQPAVSPQSSPPTGSRPRRSSSTSFHDGPGGLGLSCVYEPAQPLVDLIFVHGLHGGSFKTWRAKPEPGFFWPGEWLPQDPEFKYVRIHTFGYPANWSDFQESHLNVANFGESLRANLLSSPELNRGARTRIVMVGHSMGGLVIKKACLLCKEAQDEDHGDLLHRIKCLMFMATPHHGSDSAERLDKILRTASGAVGTKDYLRDLKKGGLCNQVINTAFKFIADKYMLYSFYETRPTGHLGLIVDEDAACIGGPKHENVVLMNADHRSICKFESQEDASFRTFRNHLIQVLDKLIGYESSSDGTLPIEAYLECEDPHDGALEIVLAPKISGSCRWIEYRPEFNNWRQDTSRQHRLYWVHASPGTGKSVLAATVFQDLTGKDSSCFFFVRGQVKRNTVSAMLRMLALQLARRYPEVLNAIQDMQRKEVQLDKLDERLVWRKLFVNCIFKLKPHTTQFWIIDGLDECHDMEKLFTLLRTASSSWPTLRIFVTSRPNPEIRHEIRQLSEMKSLSGCLFLTTEDAISPEDTNSDIEEFLRIGHDAIPVDDLQKKMTLLHRIARNSHGCFLRAKVVLKNIEKAIDKDEIETILNEVPSDMVPQYQAIVEQMGYQVSKTRRKAQIKALLTWAVCCARPLTEAELQAALPLDAESNLNGIVSSIPRTVEKLCGQLLMVNKQGAVQPVHSTVREFLLNKKTQSEFAIRKEDGHARLAKVCLNYLASKEMQAPRNNRTSKKKGGSSEKKSAFAAYAAAGFYTHLASCRSDNDEVFQALHDFLAGNNVLSWVEYVAQNFNSLDHVKEAGVNIRRFAERRSKHIAPVGPEFHTVQNWGLDLIHIVAKFGHHILFTPKNMASLLPPICPTTSNIRQQYQSNRTSDFRVVGLSDEIWYDSISYMEHTRSTPSAIAVGMKWVAIGESSGMVKLYSKTTYAELFSLNHGEEVTLMCFSCLGDLLVTAGRTMARCWATTDDLGDSEPMWTRGLQNPCVKFYFEDDDQILAITSGNSMLVWQVDGSDSGSEDNGEVPLALEDEKVHQPPDEVGADAAGPLQCASFSPDGSLVALAHGRSISLWNIRETDNVAFEGTWDRATAAVTNENQEVEAMLFNPNSDLEYLAVTYKGTRCELVLFDYSNAGLIEAKAVAAEPYALASSPDGHTLATGNTRGNIQIWDFQTLTQIYFIGYNSFAVRELAFSHDGKRLLDLRQTHSVVWEPAVLVRNHDDEDAMSTSETYAAMQNSKYLSSWGAPKEITATALHPSISVAFVGKENGNVSLYDLARGCKLQKLVSLQHGMPITNIAFGKRNILACADSTGAVAVAKVDVVLKPGTGDIDTSTTGELQWLISPPRVGEQVVPVVQLVFNGSGGGLVVATQASTQIWTLSQAGNMELASTTDGPTGPWWRFTTYNDDENQFQLIDKSLETFVRPGSGATADDDDDDKDKDGAGLGIKQGGRTTADAGSARCRGTEEGASTPAHGLPKSTAIRRVVTDPETGYIMVEYIGARSTTQLVILEQTPRPSSPGFEEAAGSGAVPQVLGHVAPPQSSPTSPLATAAPGSMSTGDRAHRAAPGWTDSLRVLEHLGPNQIRMFLGVWNRKAVYLSPGLWVQTVPLSHLSFGTKSVRGKHFFVPHEYLGGNHNVQARVGSKGEVIFPRRGELAVVWGGIAGRNN